MTTALASTTTRPRPRQARVVAMIRDRYEATLATGVMEARADLADLPAFGATHYAGLVMGA